MDWGAKPHLLLMYAKFSKVYASVGLYSKANELQRVVRRALETLRGYESSGNKTHDSLLGSNAVGSELR
jgi:hypothetical protein